jgi:hypothetical protein
MFETFALTSDNKTSGRGQDKSESAVCIVEKYHTDGRAAATCRVFIMAMSAATGREKIYSLMMNAKAALSFSPAHGSRSGKMTLSWLRSLEHTQKISMHAKYFHFRLLLNFLYQFSSSSIIIHFASAHSPAGTFEYFCCSLLNSLTASVSLQTTFLLSQNKFPLG